MNQEQQVTDQSIEQEIQAKGKTAPRVTPTDIEANIADCEVVTFVSRGRKVLRWAVLTTRNGYAVTGQPSCSVSPENDDADIGQRIAIQNAKHELWGLMGYELQQRLHEQSNDFPLGKACDLSGEGTCEACQ